MTMNDIEIIDTKASNIFEKDGLSTQDRNRLKTLRKHANLQTHTGVMMSECQKKVTITITTSIELPLAVLQQRKQNHNLKFLQLNASNHDANHNNDNNAPVMEEPHDEEEAVLQLFISSENEKHEACVVLHRADDHKNSFAKRKEIQDTKHKSEKDDESDTPSIGDDQSTVEYTVDNGLNDDNGSSDEGIQSTDDSDLARSDEEDMNETSEEEEETEEEDETEEEEEESSASEWTNSYAAGVTAKLETNVQCIRVTLMFERMLPTEFALKLNAHFIDRYVDVDIKGYCLKKYHQKVQDMLFNMKRNKTLVDMALNGEFKVLCEMSNEDCATEEMKQERQERERQNTMNVTKDSNDNAYQPVNRTLGWRRRDN